MENQEQALESKYDCLLFDLDDTLYPLGNGISAQVTKNIQEYMLVKLGIDESKIPELCVFLYKNYGTTMAGLKALGYEFDYDDFHTFVHGRLPYDNLKPDPVLRRILNSLPIRKLLFTNGDDAHAERALARLGLEDCFQSIISFETLNPNRNAEQKSNAGIIDIKKYLGRPDSELPKTPVLCKPFPESFQKVFDMENIDPKRTVFFDDSIRNIQTGKRVSLTTVLIGSSHRITGVDYALESIHNIKEALPELWETEEKIKGVGYSGKIAIETSVEA